MYEYSLKTATISSVPIAVPIKETHYPNSVNVC